MRGGAAGGGGGVDQAEGTCGYALPLFLYCLAVFLCVAHSFSLPPSILSYTHTLTPTPPLSKNQIKRRHQAPPLGGEPGHGVRRRHLPRRGRRQVHPRDPRCVSFFSFWDNFSCVWGGTYVYICTHTHSLPKKTKQNTTTQPTHTHRTNKQICKQAPAAAPSTTGRCAWRPPPAAGAPSPRCSRHVLRLMS